MAGSDDHRRQTEAQRILDRIQREADSGSVMTRATAGLRDHVTAKDRDAEDRVEYWGTRIGRALGLIICAALIIWLLVFLIRGG